MLGLYESLWQKLSQLEFNQKDIQLLKSITQSKLKNPIQGDYPRWFEAYTNLPKIDKVNCKHGTDAITCESDELLLKKVSQQIENCYQQLIPWRKGPFKMFDTFIDAEWQSQMKWNRIKDKLPNLTKKLVLDVGCGNGYYMFRMAKENLLLLLGIDPGLLQIMQFWSIEKYQQSGAFVLPLSMQQMPSTINKFDVTFSMGVLYHRKSPIQHLKELANSLVSGGHLVIETLVVEGDETRCLIPANRYAQMRNVWFLPSVSMLTTMLQRSGFKDVTCIDVTNTTTQEQRTTKWMKFHSLEQFLNKEKTKTIEGYDLPKRATLIAQKK